MKIKKILVPFDATKYSIRAYKSAIDLAVKYNSKITVLCCIDTQSWYYRFFDSRIEKARTKKQKKYLESELTPLQNLAKKNHIEFNYEIKLTPTVSKQILVYSKSKKFDLIVMGSHGRRGFNKMILGSVANEVIQKSPCPVFLEKKI